MYTVYLMDEFCFNRIHLFFIGNFSQPTTYSINNKTQIMNFDFYTNLTKINFPIDLSPIPQKNITPPNKIRRVIYKCLFKFQTDIVTN